MKSEIPFFIRNAFLTLFVVITATITFQGESHSQAAKKKKIYISTIKATGVPAGLAARVKDRLKLTVFEKHGTEYYVLDDDAIRVMYKQAEKILASGCDDVSCITQIADGINTDEIIYGEVKREGGDIAIVMNNLVRDKATLQIGTKSIVTLSFREEFLDHFVGEAAKKLINPAYAIDRRAEAAIAMKAEGLDIAVMRFTSTDENIQPIIAYLKEFVEKGDAAYNRKDYEGAYEQYAGVMNKINMKVSKEKRVKMGEFISGVHKRMDACRVLKASDYESRADKAYGEYRFEESLEDYSVSLAEAERISEVGKRDTYVRRLGGKVTTVKKTGTNYLTNQVKSLLDQAEFKNLQDKMGEAKAVMSKARQMITTSAFGTKEVVEQYNKTARRLGVATIALIDVAAQAPVQNPAAVNEITIGGIRFVKILAGEFKMGSAEGESHGNGEKPQHRVQLDSFLIGRYEVTQMQYLEIMDMNPSGFKGENLPVENVTWDDAVEFCNQFSQKFGVAARLPSEAEWEYTCRAGVMAKYYWGKDIERKPGYCWYQENSKRTTHVVGQKKPNNWGVYDMYGNVAEWCVDWYNGDYYGMSPRTNPRGPEKGSERVVRGGGWSTDGYRITSAYRFKGKPSSKKDSIGFRIVVVPGG